MSKRARLIYINSITCLIGGTLMIPVSVYIERQRVAGSAVGIIFTALGTLVVTGFASAAGEK